MKLTATLFTLVVALGLTAEVQAQNACTGTAGTDFQEVTLRDVNALTQTTIDALNAGGADLTDEEIEAALQGSPLAGETIQVTAVLLTDPLLSGLASLNEQGIPNRIHVFIRDVAAETAAGVAGMGGQIVDGRGDGTIQQLFAGDEVTICADVTYFGNILQLSPSAIVNNNNPRAADAAIRQPVTITTDEIHNVFDVDGADRSQVDWSVYPDFVNQYVRLEGTELVQGIPAGNNGRANMLFSSSGTDATLRSYDTSVCFRNDRGEDYFAAGQQPACNEEDFVPPPTGVINVQGFLTLPGFDAFTSAVPSGDAAFSISPMEAEDFEIAVAPPIITSDVAAIPSPSAGATVQANVVPGTSGNTIASVVANYTTSGGGEGEVALASTSGDDFEGTITGLTAGEFVTYTITATDNQGAASVTSATTLRVVDGPVASILDIQVTPDSGPGASSLVTSEPVAFDLDAVVQTAYQSGSRFQATIQDDPALGPFSGVLIDFGSDDPELNVGDQITITEARVTEFRDATQLTDVVFTVTGSGDPYPAKTVTTDLFNGAAGDETAEQHEGMLLRFEDVTVTSNNPDGDRNFGEFAISSDGTDENAIRVDDAANAVGSPDSDGNGGFNSELVVGQELSLVQGYLTYSFGNYKLIPTAFGDIAYAVAAENGPEAGTARIVSTFPNPATDVARVRFALDAPGQAALRLFDVTGRQVATLAEGAFGADVHEVSADLGALAAGVYVLRLEAEGAVASARLSIVR